MAKAIALFTGIDTFTRHVHVAVRADGQQFYRNYDFNGYGKGWMKWTPLGNPVTIKEDHCEWGFKTLSRAPSTKGIRLPA
jgi:hypothetical protein